MKLLSIIIPHFNDIDNLNILINSIDLSDDIEVIIVDDCSEYDIKFNNEKVVVVKQKIKSNAGNCRNIGLKAAKGEYVLFCDSDDILNSHILKCLKDFKINDKKSSDVIFFKSKTFSLNKSTETSDRSSYYNNLIDNYLNCKPNSRELLLYRFYSPCCKFIKTSFLKSNEIIFDNLLAGNDINFSLKLGVLSNNIGIINEIGYLIQDREGSLVKFDSYERLRDRIKSIENYNRTLLKYKINFKRLRFYHLLPRILKTEKAINLIFKLISSIFKIKLKSIC